MQTIIKYALIIAGLMWVGGQLDMTAIQAAQDHEALMRSTVSHMGWLILWVTLWVGLFMGIYGELWR